MCVYVCVLGVCVSYDWARLLQLWGGEGVWFSLFFFSLQGACENASMFCHLISCL